LASGRVSLLLALEVAPTGRATADRHRAARADPAAEHREPALGRATHSRYTQRSNINACAQRVVSSRSTTGRGTEQLLFVTQEAGQAKIVGYAECAYDISGGDNWLNERYFRSPSPASVAAWGGAIEIPSAPPAGRYPKRRNDRPRLAVRRSSRQLPFLPVLRRLGRGSRRNRLRFVIDARSNRNVAAV
jgi:hypothetical protein